MSGYDMAIAIGGEAGQGIATPGDILARLFTRRGLHLNTYNAFQSIVRGGHIFLTTLAPIKGVNSDSGTGISHEQRVQIALAQRIQFLG